jgi:flagellin
MEVNNISNNNISSVNNLQQNRTLEKVAAGLRINKAADDAASLVISENLIIQKSELSRSIENYNEGIAMSNIAQSGLESQKEILMGLRDDALKAMNATVSDEGKEAIRQDMAKQLEQFSMISENTKFADKSLLNVNGELEFAGPDSTIAVNTTDTSTIGTGLEGFLSDMSPENLSKMVDAIDKGLNDLNKTAGEFGAVSNQLESSARNSITAEVNIAKANSSLTEVDFGKEVTDFSKQSIMMQVGYLVSTQANAVQENNIRLLSSS